jgi:hypothetical protein
MNKRIEELVKQAQEYAGQQIDEGADYNQYPRYYTEKLAELIVKECLKIVEPDRTSGDEWCVTLDETAQSIRQHFGVEE